MSRCVGLEHFLIRTFLRSLSRLMLCL